MRRVAAVPVAKLRYILAALDLSHSPQGMSLPQFQPRVEGVLKGHRAVQVSGNWRVTFRFEDGAAIDVNYVDYH